MLIFEFSWCFSCAQHESNDCKWILCSVLFSGQFGFHCDNYMFARKEATVVIIRWQWRETGFWGLIICHWRGNKWEKLHPIEWKKTIKFDISRGHTHFYLRPSHLPPKIIFLKFCINLFPLSVHLVKREREKTKIMTESLRSRITRLEPISLTVTSSFCYA